MSRDVHALAILGQSLYSRLADLRVLIVGSGGIGCELRMWQFYMHGETGDFNKHPQ